MARSLLTAAGLPELVTGTVEEYEAIAVELATNPPKYESVRRQVEAKRLTSWLFDTEQVRSAFWFNSVFVLSGLCLRALRSVARFQPRNNSPHAPAL